MKKKVKTLLFGMPSECAAVGEALCNMSGFSEGVPEYRCVNDLEEFEQALAVWMPSLVIVLADGAAGLESVYRSRLRRPCLPVFWFSDDREFGMQAYRLDCAYFSTKPVTPEKMSSAIRRCEHIGISYATA